MPLTVGSALTGNQHPENTAKSEKKVKRKNSREKRSQFDILVFKGPAELREVYKCS